MWKWFINIVYLRKEKLIYLTRTHTYTHIIHLPFKTLGKKICNLHYLKMSHFAERVLFHVEYPARTHSMLPAKMYAQHGAIYRLFQTGTSIHTCSGYMLGSCLKQSCFCSFVCECVGLLDLRRSGRLKLQLYLQNRQNLRKIRIKWDLKFTREVQMKQKAEYWLLASRHAAIS